MFKCNKSIYHVSTWIFFFIALFILPCMSFHCMHDKVNELRKTSTTYTRSVKYQDIKTQRERKPGLFEPLRIHFYVDNIEESVSSNVIHNVELALRNIKEFIKNTFQVRKRKNPFVLERQGCAQRWQSGRNKGKCSKFTSDTEICAAKEIYHMIPASFLDKLEIYDFEDSHPRYGATSGPGLLDSNFITFVTSQSSSLCEGTDVSAYGTYCRLDSKTNEPLAGILNLCPYYFSKKIYTSQHYYNVILHEMFHILGFSFHLFEKYLPCEKGIFCNVPKNVIQEDETEIARIMFPLVIESTQNHFGCSKPDFGGPMAKKEQSDNSSDNIVYTSHWHPVLMYSSIMTPSFSEYDQVFVDNITLSVFASTGWYRMNFSNVENFKFGKEQGCDFGMEGSCDNSIYLCNPSNSTTGCDLVHKTIGKCTSLTSTDPCGIYQPYSEEDCESDSETQFVLDLYSLGYKQKCFMSQEPNSQYKPSCLPVKCKSEQTYDILINMTWYPCHHSDQISVRNVSIICPESFLFCSGTVTPTARHFCPAEKYFFIAIRMYFRLPSYKGLSDFQNFKNFKVATLRGIAEKIEIPVNYIVNASLSVFKKIILDFAICPTPSISASELNGIVTRAQKFLDSGNFMHLLKGPTRMVISSNNIKIDPAEVITFSDHEGFRVLLVFPVLCAIFLVATFVASILRFFLIQKHRPQRTSQRPDNIQLSEVSSPS